MANKVKFGLRNVWIAPITSTSPSYTYSTPFSLPGAVNLTLTATGDRNDFFADDVVYFAQYANNGYEGELEIAMITDEFRTAILGETADGNEALVETADDIITPFAMGFEVQGDDKGRRCWYYNVTAGRPGADAQTTEATITPQTDTLQITAAARITDHAVRVVMPLTSSNSTAYSNFFSSVYEKV